MCRFSRSSRAKRCSVDSSCPAPVRSPPACAERARRAGELCRELTGVRARCSPSVTVSVAVCVRVAILEIRLSALLASLAARASSNDAVISENNLRAAASSDSSAAVVSTVDVPSMINEFSSSVVSTLLHAAFQSASENSGGLSSWNLIGPLPFPSRRAVAPSGGVRRCPAELDDATGFSGLVALVATLVTVAGVRFRLSADRARSSSRASCSQSLLIASLARPATCW